MRKLVSIFLVSCILLSNLFPAVVLAQEIDVIEQDMPMTTSDVDTNQGILELDLKFVLPMKNFENSNIEVILKKGEESFTFDLNGITTMTVRDYQLGNHTGTVQVRKTDKQGYVINGVDGELVKYYAITFYGLEKGNYSVELRGAGYKNAVVSDVMIDQYSKRISITNEKGGFEVGDVNQDQIVDEQDLIVLRSALENSIGYDSHYDLNRDGIVDVADLAILSRGLYSSVQTVRVDDTYAILNEENLTMEGNLEGTIRDLITGNRPITVKPVLETQEITSANPASIVFHVKDSVLTSQIRLDVTEDHVPEEMLIDIEDEFGEVHSFTQNYVLNTHSDIHYFTDKPSLNTIVIDLEGQIAIKKVTIHITKTSTKNLAEIAKVELLNNVYEEVPVPKMEAPKNLTVETGSERATIHYSELPNVTGYEILVESTVNGQVVQNPIYQTNYTNYDFTDLKNYTQYRVKVRAVNQEWRSAWSDEVTFMPEPNRLPPKVDMVTLTPVSSGFNIGYKKMDDTLSYNIYYRIKDTLEFTVIRNIVETSYSLRDLQEGTTYEIYVTGNNGLGEGPKSETVVGTTKVAALPDTTNYHLINRVNGEEGKTSHIKSVTYSSNAYQASEFALVDHDYDTFWRADTWDLGGYNPGNGGPLIELDDTYMIDHIEIVPGDDSASFMYARVNYWNQNNERVTIPASIMRKTSPNGQIYYTVSFEKVETSKIQVNLANYLAVGNITMREIKIYEYDSLEDDVAALFADDLHVELKPEVTDSMIQSLEDRANTIEVISGEYHPYREVLLEELAYARKILHDTGLYDSIVVDQAISNNQNKHLGFAMQISDLQPLGVAVRAGEQIIVYVGTTSGRLPQLVFTQFHAEANTWQNTTISLKKGQNIITVPQIGSMQTERGGSIYVRYPYADEAGEIKVRVSGGTRIPILDVHSITDSQETKNQIRKYIEELTQYVDQLPLMYQESGVPYDVYNAVLNTTEIVTRDGLFSVAATATLNGIRTGKNTIEEQVERVYQSLLAFDEMMTIFYNHKGLVENAEDGKDRRPHARINIRYMRMFDGAFMYAGGGHVGVEYSSIPGLLQGMPASKNGEDITTTGYFGWGISHEIGHQINQGSFAIAEITNNVFSLLAQTADDKQLARIEPLYEKIYQKVTSGTTGKASNVFVSLGLYWQLHLAYDNGKTFDDTNSIFARINHLARTTTLKASRDDLLVMLASEAASKDLTDFFIHWGYTPSEEAIAYASKFEKETRKIWYLNDVARRYRMNQGNSMSSDTVLSVQLQEDSQNKRYTLQMSVSKDSDCILGYEIKRNGVVIGFTQNSVFTDVIGSMNNQVLVYEVTAYDRYLNATETVMLDEVKVMHDGSIVKDNFTISSNYKQSGEIIDYENPDMDVNALHVHDLLDGNRETAFLGTEKVNEQDQADPYVMIDMNTKLDIAGIKYHTKRENGKLLDGTIQHYRISVSKDRENWIVAKEGVFDFTSSDEVTIYFDQEGTSGGNQLWTYEDISYVKIEAIGQTAISGTEIDIIAPPGDNIDTTGEIGILSEDYHYVDGDGKDAIIEKGSIVLKGNYRGNPAFNVVLLVNAQNSDEVYDGTHFLFAKLTDQNTVYEVADGIWFYVFTKEQYASLIGKDVRAELYRVNDAITSEGQRLTSTSFRIENLPTYENLPELQIVDSTKGE